MAKRRTGFFKKLIFLVIIIALLPKLSTFLNLNIISKIKGKPKVSVSEEYKNLENIYSNNAVVIERKNQKIMRGKNYKERIHPASMTKVMTAIIGLEEVKNLNSRAEITQDIIDYSINNGLSVSGFEAGEEPKIIDLLYGILLESGGESSIALARYVSGSEEEFAILMNKKAEELGMENTNFTNSTGITGENHYSTAKDIGILFEYALRNNKFKEIISSKNYRTKGLKGFGTKHSIDNQLFYKRNALNINKDYIKLGKTGYTDAAGLCLVSLGEVNNKEYIVVTANSRGDSQTEQFNLTDVERIYNELIGVNT